MELPLEILLQIATVDATAYKYMLALPPFARFALGAKKYVENLLIKKYSYGSSTKYYLGNKLHRDDGPAIISNQVTWWYQYGKPHRGDDLPAYENIDGTKAWFLWGKQHRDGDLPAVMRANGSKEWWYEDKLHRVGGPSLLLSNGYEAWHNHGFLHRECGPAQTFPSGEKYYYNMGKQLSITERILKYIGIRGVS